MSQTSLGRVQPLYKGTYVSTTTYSKFDNVYSVANGASYVSLVDNNNWGLPQQGAVSNDYWQMVATRGAKGDMPTLAVGTVESGATAAASITSLNSNYYLNLTLPQGPQGERGPSGVSYATADVTSSGTEASVNVTFNSGTGQLDFDFNIPSPSGAAVQTVDSITPNVSGNVILNAVTYTQGAVLTGDNKVNALVNIGAIATPSNAQTGNVLTYNGTNWIAGTVDALPSGGATGNILAKTDSGATWMASISTSEINTLFNNLSS